MIKTNELNFINYVLKEIKNLLINILILIVIINLSLNAEETKLIILLMLRIIVIFNIMYIILKLTICLIKILMHPTQTINELKKIKTESEEQWVK